VSKEDVVMAQRGWASDSPTGGWRPQTVIIGHGSELSDSLNNYCNWRIAAESGVRDKAVSLITKHYRAWFENCPHCSHVCFADITFFSPDQVSVRDALTIVFVPEVPKPESNYDNYIRVLGQYIDDGNGHTMAPHAVFTHGLPRVEGVFVPETADELAQFFAEVQSENRFEQVTEGLLCWKSLERPGLVEPPSDEPLPYLARAIPTYSKRTYTDQFIRIVSQKRISEQFEAWVALWRNEAQEGRQLSGFRRPIHHIIAAPIGFRRSFWTDKDDYTLIACLFLAVDDSLVIDDAALLEIIRYIYLHITHANAAAWLLRKGELTGRDAHIIPASHELAKVVTAIQANLPPSAYPLLRLYFDDVLLAGIRPVSAERIWLGEFIRERVTLAAKIEFVVNVARTGKFGSSTDFDHALNAFVCSVTGQMSVSHDLESCRLDYSADETSAFGHAILGAVRNAIFHSLAKDDIKFEFFVRLENELPCLIIQNSFTSQFEFQRLSEGKPEGGTLKALRSYTRAFGKDPRLVKLRRTHHATDYGPKKKLFETWEAVIPMPGNSEETLT
jgi:hypothetical protein